MSGIGGLGFWVYVGTIAGIYAVFGLGLQLQLGYAGLMNFGHVAFMAVGAYVMAILTVRVGMSMWYASILGVVGAVAFAVVLGLPALRLRAEYFAIATLAMAEIVQYVALNATGLTGGVLGTSALSHSGVPAFYNTTWIVFQAGVQRHLTELLGTQVSSATAMLIIVWVVVVLAVLLVQFMVHKPWGRALRGVREDEDAVAALGKNAFALKLQALGIGAMLGGIAGLLFAYQFSYFSSEDFEPLLTLTGFMIVIIGGHARNWGVTIGALIFGFLYAASRFLNFAPFSLVSSSDRAYLRLLIVGIVLVALMAFRPQGIFGRREELALD
ncbi:MAG: branched-chain amino acid ABC transporter permease [Solirubrobacteraceae bacterium]